MLTAQLCTSIATPPEGDQWLHELKFDGYRMFCRLESGRAQFISRNGQDWTSRMALLPAAAAKLPAAAAVLDGEVVVLDEQGVSSFQALQNSFRRRGEVALVYYAFDVIHLDGYDLSRVPLEDRKAVLESLVAAAPAAARAIRYSEHIIGSGPAFHRQVCEARLEGGIAKRRDSLYVGGRTASWLKYKCRQGQEFVVGGYTQPAGSRIGFGALLVGYYRADGKLAYAGRVGTGFNDRLLAELLAKLQRLEQADSPFVDFPRARAGVHWVRPKLVAQVEFANWTDEGLLRQAAFQGLRTDKPPREVLRDAPGTARTAAK